MRTYLFRSIALMCLLISVSCSKSDDNENNQNENDQIDNNQNDNGQPTPEDLTIVTIEPFDIKPFNATTGGDIMNDSEVILIERGIVWADSPSPTDNDNVIVDQTGLGEGTYTTGFECLDVASTFYVRAYARSSDAIYYGNEISFSTLSHNTFLGDIMLNNQEEVDAFGASDYSRIDGSLQVNGFMNMNLTSLKGLSEVTGSLVIGVSPGQILELNGLNCLKEVGERLELRGLDSFDELFNLERIGGNFMLTNVDQGDLRGFDKLTYIGARFSFVGGDITELVGLNNVTDLGSDLDAADSSLVIEIRDSNLNTINLFNSVNTDIPGIDIRNNTNLTNIDGFNILTNVEAINISGNVSNSITISGFNSLEEVDELRIFSNRTN